MVYKMFFWVVVLCTVFMDTEPEKNLLKTF